ncbi:hypothetical protein OK016_22210 [Vibrio chagasii]|nr:hypothetical protein [Vibrio chagasii]
MNELGVSETAEVVDVADANDAGFFAELVKEWITRSAKRKTL